MNCSSISRQRCQSIDTLLFLATVLPHWERQRISTRTKQRLYRTKAMRSLRHPSLHAPPETAPLPNPLRGVPTVQMQARVDAAGSRFALPAAQAAPASFAFLFTRGRPSEQAAPSITARSAAPRVRASWGGRSKARGRFTAATAFEAGPCGPGQEIAGAWGGGVVGDIAEGSHGGLRP